MPTVAQLKTELRKLGVSVSGNKSELELRLYSSMLALQRAAAADAATQATGGCLLPRGSDHTHHSQIGRVLDTLKRFFNPLHMASATLFQRPLHAYISHTMTEFGGSEERVAQQRAAWRAARSRRHLPHPPWR
jgi:hypothetical protein